MRSKRFSERNLISNVNVKVRGTVSRIVIEIKFLKIGIKFMNS